MRNLKKLLTFYSIILLSSLLLLFGCESSNAPAESGSLLVKVTDDPFPTNLVESATVIVDKIEIRKKDDSEDNPFIVVGSGKTNTGQNQRDQQHYWEN